MAIKNWHGGKFVLVWVVGLGTAVVENVKDLAALLLAQVLAPIAALAAGFLFGKTT